MTGIDVSAVWDALGAAVTTALATGKACYVYPVEDLTTGDAFVDYPQDPQPIAATFGRGLDRVALDVVLIGGLPQDKSARDAIADYITGNGSVVAAIEGYSTSAWSSASVTTWQIGTYVPNGRPSLLAVRYRVDILTR